MKGKMVVGVVGAGSMGAGIAQVCATNGHQVCLYDSFEDAIKSAESKITTILNRLIEKERISLSIKALFIYIDSSIGKQYSKEFLSSKKL